jgi:hypothetical protein
LLIYDIIYKKEIIMSDIEIRTFAFVVDGDVVGTIHVPSTSTNHQRLWAGLSSGAIVVESTGTPGVEHGWLFDGEKFTPPSE